MCKFLLGRISVPITPNYQPCGIRYGAKCNNYCYHNLLPPFLSIWLNRFSISIMSPAILHAVYVTAAAVNVIINVIIVFYIAFIVIYFARVPLLG